MKSVERVVRNSFIVSGAIVLALVSIAASVSFSFGGIMGGKLENSMEIVRISDTDNPITYKDAEKLRSSSAIEQLSAYSESKVYVLSGTGVYGGNVKAVLIDENFGKTYKYRMISGVFPDEREVAAAENCAVISDSLSSRLYKSLDAVGNEVEISGRKYFVTGVYSTDGLKLQELCGDGYDRIFIPYGSYDGGQRNTVDVINIRKNPETAKNIVENEIDRVLFSKLNAYRLDSCDTISTLSSQYIGLFTFLAGILAAVFIFVFVIRLISGTVKYIRDKMKGGYLVEIIKAEAGKLAVGLSAVILGGALIFVLIRQIGFRFHIADEYIPTDNIFDFGFYWQKITEGIHNAGAAQAYSHFSGILGNTLKLELFCVFLAFVLFAVCMVFLKLLTALETGVVRILEYILAASAAGLAAGLCVSFALGLKVCVPVKFWLVMSFGMAVYTLLKNKKGWWTE